MSDILSKTMAAPSRAAASTKRHSRRIVGTDPGPLLGDESLTGDKATAAVALPTGRNDRRARRPFFEPSSLELSGADPPHRAEGTSEAEHSNASTERKVAMIASHTRGSVPISRWLNGKPSAFARQDLSAFVQSAVS